MLIIHIEASHQKGMGHLFRCLNFINGLKKYSPKTRYLVVVNNDERARAILEAQKVQYLAVDCAGEPNWERSLIEKYQVTCWLNDRLDTLESEVERVKGLGIPVYTIDDKGSGAAISDINFASLVFNNEYELLGEKVLTGEKYLILNPEIDTFRQQKSNLKKVIITMGGSDTYNLTLKVVRAVVEVKLPLDITVIIGPGSRCYKQVEDIIGLHDSREDNATGLETNIAIKSNVPSLIEELGKNDLAFTAGGVTPFEAAALGLPTISIAAEMHEIGICERLEVLGCSRFLGFRDAVDVEDIKKAIIDMYDAPDVIGRMSQNGLENVDTNGVRRIIEEMDIDDR